MIPKTIHYAWFGPKELPELAIKCLESWKKNCPDYKIIRWSEENFDINICDYVKEAYENKKYAFVSDFVRLYALVQHGGVYMDTDVELIKPIDEFLCEKAFSGFESFTDVPTGIMGAERGFRLFEELLDAYRDRHFVQPDGKLDMTTNVAAITDSCVKHGLVRNNTKQRVAGLTLYPKDYFCPKDWTNGMIHITTNTCAIHHYSGSWLKKVSKSLICSRLKEIKGASKLYLYGAGKYAEECIKILDMADVKIHGIVVTELEKKYTFYGHKIIEADCIEDKDALVLIAVREQFYQEIVNGLNDRGIKNYIYVCE